MEPYRPYVDKVVYDILEECPDAEISTSVKIKLLNIPVVEVLIGGKRSPLMVAVTHTTTSLVKCFRGESRRLAYPEMQ